MDLLHPLLLGGWMDPNWLLQHFGSAFFWVSMAIVFVECGLLFPILPGDTLLFAMGLFIATNKIEMFTSSHVVNLLVSLVLLVIAAFMGNVAGYEIGRKVGPPLYERNGRIIKRKYLDETREFFDKHGNPALVIGRFVPFVRTFITLVAGISRMERHRFLAWSFVGAVLWVAAVTLLGFFLGQAFPWIGEKLDVAIIVLLVISLLPLGIEWLRRRRRTA